MELNKTNKRLIAARRPFSVVEIENDPRITNVNGKQSSYNIVGKNGSGIAEFGCDELAALWFCEAANRYADEIYNRRSAPPHTGNGYAKLREALKQIVELTAPGEGVTSIELQVQAEAITALEATEKEGGAK